MYPPILVLTYLVITSSKQILSLDDTIFQFEDVSEESSPSINLYDDISATSEDEGNYHQNLTSSGYYFMTPSSDYVDDNNTVSGEQQSTTGASVLTSGEAIENKTSSGEHFMKPSRIQAFIGDDPKYQQSSLEDFINSNVDHQTTDTLRSSTVLDTTWNNNLLYTANNNDSFVVTSIEKEPEEESVEISEEEISVYTTTFPTLLAVPDEILPTTPLLSKTELLFQLINDQNLRTPIAFLIDTSNDSLNNAKRQLEVALRPKTPLDSILVRYNSTGVAQSSSFRNTKTLMDAISNIKPSYDQHGKGFVGILRSCQQIPFDSAIFLATSHPASDDDLYRDAALTLLKKRIRLYVIWFGDLFEINSSVPQYLGMSTGYLQELAYKTGGRVIPFDDHDLLTTLVSKDDLKGPQTIEFPVEDNAISLRFQLHGNVDTAILRTPNGEFLDLLEVAKYLNNIIRSKISVSTSGVYSLKTTGREGLDVDNNEGYGVTVKVEKKLDHAYELDYADSYAETQFEQIEKYQNNLEGAYYKHHVRSQKQVSSSNENQTQYVPDDESGTNPRSITQSITKIDIGIQSQLMATRGSTIQIYYEVSNLRNLPNTYFFQVTDELSYLRLLNPQSVILGAQQTATVIVTATIPITAEVGVKDKITFRAQGSDVTTQSAFITVTEAGGLQDSYQPWLYYTYTSRCEGRATPGTCTGAFWTLEVTARDYETGILRISSSPRGIIYKAPFTAGTRDEVKATYTASCCQHKVTISAYDLNRNQKTVSLDVTDIWLNELGIAAIVLGILLIIVLIILIVLMIRCCVKRKRASRDLPVYRSDARTRPSAAS